MRDAVTPILMPIASWAADKRVLENQTATGRDELLKIRKGRWA